MVLKGVTIPMIRSLFKSIILRDEGLKLEYYIISSDIRHEKKLFFSYGIEIVQTSVSSKCKLKDASSHITDITTSYNKILNFTAFLCANAVDPSMLYDAVTDGLEEGIF